MIMRYASVIGLRPEHAGRYRELHSQVWPEVMAALHAHHITNYSIFHRDGTLFCYYEYTGHDHLADLRSIADDPITQEWWAMTSPCQEPVLSADPDEWWAPAEELFHLD
jgi:L-rhamnose mutarotase